MGSSLEDGLNQNCGPLAAVQAADLIQNFVSPIHKSQLEMYEAITDASHQQQITFLLLLSN